MDKINHSLYCSNESAVKKLEQMIEEEKAKKKSTDSKSD